MKKFECRKWSETEEEFLRRCYSTNMPLKEICERLDRTKKSVICHCNLVLKIYRPCVHEFVCADCGRVVRTHGGKDKRTRFCCARCEKKFWQHPTWERKGSSTVYQGGLRHALGVQRAENKLGALD